MRLATIAIVAFALLASKASVAVAALVGAPRTVVLCTGTGLVRVAVSAEGHVLDGPGAASLAGAGHCDLVASPPGDVERRWATIGRPSGTARSLAAAPGGRVAASRAPHDPLPRGPPRAR